MVVTARSHVITIQFSMSVGTRAMRYLCFSDAGEQWEISWIAKLPARVEHLRLRLFVLRNALFDIWTQIETDPAFAQKSTQFESFLQTHVITDEYLKTVMDTWIHIAPGT